MLASNRSPNQPGSFHDRQVDLEEPLLLDAFEERPSTRKCTWQQTTAALLSLQLGWGLWLFPSDFARLGWVPALGATLLLTIATTYSGVIFSRLYQHVPGAVLFGDIGYRAAGRPGRLLVYGIIYSLDATRCVILHLAAAQSLQHALGGAVPPLWQCGLLVLLLAGLVVQVRSLASLSWFFVLGTCAQLLAIGVVVFQLATSPDPTAKTQAVVNPSSQGVSLDRQLVALMNMIFAFGGQFAFVELITSMREPLQFPRAISICTALMSTLYLTLGAVGYWSKGSKVAEIVVFSLGEGMLGRLAAACVLVQAIAQYLVNLNVWTHNLLVLLARKSKAKRSKSVPRGLDTAGAAGGGLETHINGVNGMNGRANSSGSMASLDHEQLFQDEPSCSSDHPHSQWFLASAFVLAYSYGISMSVPFFSSLVGIVASSTYLICAYALPCWFVLRLFGPELSWMERWLCRGIIPIALLLSAAGLVSSVSTLIQNIQHQGSGFGPEGGR